jgi:hypothetical protein
VNESFLLNSVVRNETDDDGTAAFKKGLAPSVDLDNGDWGGRDPAK